MKASERLRELMTQPHNAVGFSEAMTLANALPLIADVVEAAEAVDHYPSSKLHERLTALRDALEGGSDFDWKPPETC